MQYFGTEYCQLASYILSTSIQACMHGSHDINALCHINIYNYIFLFVSVNNGHVIQTAATCNNWIPLRNDEPIIPA